MCENEETEDWLVRADEVCMRLKENLQERCSTVRSFEQEPVSLPFWCDCLKEALLFRSTELAETAIDLYRRNLLVSGAIITRSLLETIALFNRLNESCAKVVKQHERGNYCDEIIKELLKSVQRISLATTTTRDNETQSNIEPCKVPALINSLDTRFKTDCKLKRMYDELCQFVHPNFNGCTDSFTKWNTQENYVEFIQDYHHVQLNAVRDHIFLFKILDIVEKLENEMMELLPKFAEACEEYIKRQRRKEKTWQEGKG